MALPDFNVCLAKPEGYLHSNCLLELAELLTYSLQDLGYTANLRVHEVDPACRNIIIGSHLLHPNLADDVPDSTVIVNSEQIYAEDRFGWNDRIFSWVRRFETWDYSPENIAAFAKLGIDNVKLLRIGHQPQLTRIIKSAEPDIDVLFYGSMTDRRKAIFTQLQAAGLEIVTLFGVYAQERDEYVSRSKIVLNLHNHAAEIFEVVRVHYLLSNAVAVVSEVNPTTAIPGFFRDAVAGVPYESVVDECVRLVNNSGERTALQERGYGAISRRPQTQFTKELLS